MEPITILAASGIKALLMLKTNDSIATAAKNLKNLGINVKPERLREIWGDLVDAAGGDYEAAWESFLRRINKGHRVRRRS